MNPVIAPLPMFGPKMRPPPKRGVGRPRNPVVIDYALLEKNTSRSVTVIKSITATARGALTIINNQTRGNMQIFSSRNIQRSSEAYSKTDATYENRTRPKCLEGIYANHYTNAAVGFGRHVMLYWANLFVHNLSKHKLLL